MSFYFCKLVIPTHKFKLAVLGLHGLPLRLSQLALITSQLPLRPSQLCQSPSQVLQRPSQLLPRPFQLPYEALLPLVMVIIPYGATAQLLPKTCDIGLSRVDESTSLTESASRPREKESSPDMNSKITREKEKESERRKSMF